MPYALGIDLGSGHLAAAICRNDRERWSEPEVLTLDGVAVTEAVLHLTDEGTVEVGDRALRHVTTRPDRVTRGFLDRVGDEIPITLGGQPYPAEVLIAAVVGWIADYAEASEGMPASQLVVTHPAGWGTHRRTTLQAALREVGLPELTLLPRPVAAAESYAAKERVEVGQEIAVHSLGAGRFESAVLRRGSFGFELRAHADAGEQAGGDLFDDLLAAHVLADLGHDVEPVALAKLRVACRTAKERLSTELAVTVPAPAKSPRGTVMVNRTDVEELIRPAVEATVASLQRTIQSASAGALQAVVLVGGCGRIPLVSELVSAGVRVRVTAAADPELSVARGAALAAARVAKPTVKAPALASARSAVAHTDLMRFDDLPEEENVADVGPPPPRPPVEITPLEPPKRRRLGLGTRSATDPREEEPRPAREYGLRPRRTELSGADLFAPLDDDSSPALFTHAEDADERRPTREPSDPRRDLRRRIRRESLRQDPTFDGDEEPEARQEASRDSWHKPRNRPDQGADSHHDIAPAERFDFGPESRPDLGSDSRRNVRSASQHLTDSEPGYDANPGSRRNIRTESRHHTGPESHRNILVDSRHTDSEHRRDFTPDSRRDLGTDSRYDLEGQHADLARRHNIRADSAHDTGPNNRHDRGLDNRHDLDAQHADPARRHNIRTDSGYDSGPDSRHDLGSGNRRDSHGSRGDIQVDRRHSLGGDGADRRHNPGSGGRYDIHAENRGHARSEDRYAVGSESRRDIRAESRHNSRRDLSSESRYDIYAENRHDNGSESRRNIRAENRHDLGSEGRHESRAANRHNGGGRDVPAASRGARQESRHEKHGFRREAGHHSGEVPQEGSHRSRHESGRRHRTDDRAFNESLTRARHATHGDGEDLR